MRVDFELKRVEKPRKKYAFIIKNRFVYKNMREKYRNILTIQKKYAKIGIVKVIFIIFEKNFQNYQ